MIPRHSEFAWLPSDLATTFCANALELEPQRAYGTFIDTLHLNSFWQTQVTIDQLYLIGDTRSAHELEVFVSMPLERLRLGCGLQCTLPHTTLFSAAVKLVKFALCGYCATANNEAVDALWDALCPLLINPEEHVLATIFSLLLALVEGRTDLPLSGVFGAGKTRSAAVLVAGLLVFEPGLKIMVLAKENVAAQAFAEHLELLDLPKATTASVGRLVGYMELQKGKTGETSLDVIPENRNDVLRGKRPLIGCGG